MLNVQRASVRQGRIREHTEYGEIRGIMGRVGRKTFCPRYHSMEKFLLI